MENLHFKNKRELNSFIKKLQYIDRGAEGICYRLSRKTVFKYLCGEIYYPIVDENQLLQFKNIDIANYIFAKNVVFLKEQIIGVLMKYVNGNLVDKGLYNVKIFNLIKAFEDLEISTRKLSNYGISVFDVFPSNMFYNNSRFFLIDTMWYEKVDLDPDKLFKENMVSIFSNICDNIFPLELYDFIQTLPQIREFKKDDDLLSKPSYVIKTFYDDVCKYLDSEPKTMSEIKKKIFEI